MQSRDADGAGKAVPGLVSCGKIFKAAALYFGLVFGIGFILGPIRILWLVPRVGTRSAELMEAPVMLVVTILAAGWVVRRLALPDFPSARFGMGFIALGMLLSAEFVLVPIVRGTSIRNYLATRDPVSGAVYYATLLIFAVMPRLVARNPR